MNKPCMSAILLMLALAPLQAVAVSYHAGPSARHAQTDEATTEAAGKEALCKALKRQAGLQHKPAENVMYSAGKASESGVTSPHLAGHEPLEIKPEDLQIPLRIPLTDYLRTPEAYNLNMQEVFIEPGTLQLKDGRLYLDNQPLPDNISDRLKDCEAPITEESPEAQESSE